MISAALVLSLLSITPGGADLWVLSDSPPDYGEIQAELERNPLGVLVFIARTGWTPEWLNTASLAEDIVSSGHIDSRSAAWAAWTAGYPLDFSLDPVHVEFSVDSELPAVMMFWQILFCWTVQC